MKKTNDPGSIIELLSDTPNVSGLYNSIKSNQTALSSTVSKGWYGEIYRV